MLLYFVTNELTNLGHSAIYIHTVNLNMPTKEAFFKQEFVEEQQRRLSFHSGYLVVAVPRHTGTQSRSED